MARIPPSGAEEFLAQRLVASLGTQNQDGSIHLTAVWYLFEGVKFYIATSSRSRKARNVMARPKASLMVDTRRPGSERGIVASGAAEVITGAESRQINARLHRRYMSEAALADPRLRPLLIDMDDVTICLTPATWYEWDMSAFDDAVLGGAMKTPGYLLPLD